ncbi:DUF4883 family protein [Clostridium oceanicum]|uniref:DUF4883 family protein n=1 Tax=Clostridium oceanicum TaxID=1543 RepID=A0ABN1JT19_9CLOT
MKKTTYYLSIIFIILLTFTGCSTKLPLDMINKNKPNNFYYTNLLSKNISLEASFKCNLFETNLSKEKELSKKDIEPVKTFMKLLRKPNFIKKPSNLNKKPEYKILFEFKKDKYIINVYNDKYVSIYPYDGKYAMDYISMKNIPPAYNLYNFAKYIMFGENNFSS